MRTRRERFEEIAAKRAQKVLDSLDSLSKCSNLNNYQYDEMDVKKMFSVIRSKVKTVEDLYKSRLQNTKGNKTRFKF